MLLGLSRSRSRSSTILKNGSLRVYPVYIQKVGPLRYRFNFQFACKMYEHFKLMICLG